MLAGADEIRLPNANLMKVPRMNSFKLFGRSPMNPFMNLSAGGRSGDILGSGQPGAVDLPSAGGWAGRAARPGQSQNAMGTWAGPRKRGLALMVAFVVGWGTWSALAVSDARDYAVLVSARGQTQPAQIILSWPQDTFAEPTSYQVSRKAPADTNWTLLATLSGAATNFVDTDVALNGEYEYEIHKSALGYAGYGYVLAGLEAPLVESRGAVILIVDRNFATDLAAELARLEQDLAGDGWAVLRHDVSRSDSPASVKALILADYTAAPALVRSVFLFGHVPVPYSGDLAPDGHPDHRGAWPADVYYGDMDGVWTDTSVNDSVASDPRNVNVPLDGKFDQSYVPSAVELEVGRVDLANLPSFALPERELLRQYLNKNHNFRHRRVTAQPRGLVADYFGVAYGEAFAATGWRNFAACFGASNVVASTSWFNNQATDPVLFAYGCGGGSYTSVAGLGTTSDLAQTDPAAVFTLLFGSYFGDWDTTNNVMRAALATPSYTLTCAWAGRPHWFLHRMALGGTIGASTRRSQNNNYTGPYKQLNAGGQQVHVALMGDPTLRLHPVAPPSAVAASAGLGQVALAWTPAAQPVLGYFVYQATNLAGPFTRVTSNLVTDPAFTDRGLEVGAYTHMVRAVTLEHSASGSYYNASQGAFASSAVTLAPLTITSPPDSTVELGGAWSFPIPTASGGDGEVNLSLVATVTNVTCGSSAIATRIWQASDATGNTCRATNTVMILDTTPPTVIPSVNKTVNEGSSWTFDRPSATDLNGEVTIIVVSTVTNVSGGGDFTATCSWEFSDVCSNASTGSQTVTVESAGPPIITLELRDADASELGLDTGLFVISRTGDISQPLKVRLSYGGTARSGVDYLALPTRATIPAGATTLDLLLTPLPDTKNEPTETVRITLQASSAYVLGPVVKATAFIQNGILSTVRSLATDVMAAETGSARARTYNSSPGIR